MEFGCVWSARIEVAPSLRKTTSAGRPLATIQSPRVLIACLRFKFTRSFSLLTSSPTPSAPYAQSTLEFWCRILLRSFPQPCVISASALNGRSRFTVDRHRYRSNNVGDQRAFAISGADYTVHIPPRAGGAFASSVKSPKCPPILKAELALSLHIIM